MYVWVLYIHEYYIDTVLVLFFDNKYLIDILLLKKNTVYV